MKYGSEVLIRAGGGEKNERYRDSLREGVIPVEACVVGSPADD